MSDIEKLSKLADQADNILALNQRICDLEDALAKERRENDVKVLTTKEAALILGVSSATVVSWCNKGWIPHIPSRNKYLIPKSGLFKVAEKMAAEKAARAAR